VRLVVREGMTLALTGIVAGIVGAWALRQALSALLFGIQPDDPPTFAAVAVALTGIAFFACLLPARRASRIDPMVALREE
jgi:ABC-type antimicrobial peptide transport system permease subunit